MLELNTERLRIVALDVENYGLFLYEHGQMLRNLGVTVTTEDIDENFAKMFVESYKQAKKDPINYVWYTNWQIILKSKNLIIGGLCFKGHPDENGYVEIGYGMDPNYLNNGYMTETLNVVINWALAHEAVKGVIAETEKDNIPSQKVLAKNGMEKYKETNDCYWWLINKQ